MKVFLVSWTYYDAYIIFGIATSREKAIELRDKAVKNGYKVHTIEIEEIEANKYLEDDCDSE